MNLLLSLAAHRHKSGGVTPTGPVSYIATTNTAYGTPSSQSVSTPSGTQVGDLLVCVTMTTNTPISTPAGWTLVVTVGPATAVSANKYTTVYKKIAVSGDIGGSATFAQSAGGRMGCSMSSFRRTGGCDILSTTNAIDSANTLTTTVTAPVASSLDNMVVLCSSFVTTGTSLSFASPWTNDTNTTVTDARLVVAHMAPTSTSVAESSVATCVGGGSNAKANVGILIG